jgi:hypothetical protein
VWWIQFGSISPPILGAFYDAATDKTDIRWSLLICVAFSYTSAGAVRRHSSCTTVCRHVI